jgi:hypothetical protein
VLNRAVVYTGVSLFVVGIFVIVETLLAKYVENVSHLESTALQLAVALVLGFSIRFIHARVDRIVDTLMFRECHEAELAMRNFAHDAAYMTDASALLERCIAVVTQHAQAADAGVWLREKDGRYVRAAGTLAGLEAGENDPAVLAMRARRTIVDLYKAASALPGVLGCPMIVRGQLAGILVCGDEAYAPDERDALAQWLSPSVKRCTVCASPNSSVPWSACCGAAAQPKGRWVRSSRRITRYAQD